jgi:PAS domain S-box-containing protein
MNSKSPSTSPITQQALVQLIGSLSNGVSLTDEQGNIVLWNYALEQLVDIPATEAIGKAIWDIQYPLIGDVEPVPDVYERLRETYQNLLIKGPGRESEKSTENWWIQRSSGDKRLIQATVLTIKTATGFQLGCILRDVTADHPHKTQLKALTEAVEQSPVSVVITDPEGIIEYGNSLLTTLTGYNLEDIKGNTPRIFQSGLTSPQTYDQIWSNIKSGRFWQGELRNRKKNGELFWVRITISPIFADDGSLQYFIATMEDVTTYHQAEQDLRESEQLFRTTFEQAAVGIAHVAPYGQFLRINEKFCELIGYNQNEMFSKKFQDITYPDDLNTDLQQTQLLLNGVIENFTLEKRYICKNGSIVWVQLTVALTWYDEKTPKYFIAVVQNITERKAIEAALRDSEERFRNLVESTDDIIYTLDTQHRYTGVYGRWLAKGNYSPNGFLGKTVQEVLGEAKSKTHQLANASALQGKSIIYEWVNLNRVYQNALYPLYAENNQVYGLVGISRDISDLKRIEQQLREAERFARTTFDSLSAEIVVLDEDGRIIATNQAWQKFAEANTEQQDIFSEGMNYLAVLESVDPVSESYEDAAAFLTGIKAVMCGESSEFTLEYPCHTPDQQRWFMGRVTRFIGDGPLRLVISHENVTKIKLAELSIRANHQQLELLHEAVTRQNIDLEARISERTRQLSRLNDRMIIILDNISDAILLLSRTGYIESSNASFGRLFGYENDEGFDMPIANLADPSSQNELLQAVQQIAQEQRFEQRLQITAKRKDGSRFDADVALAFVHDKTGHIVCSLRDITSLKAVERMKDEFVSMVSHELRTPITTILLSSETLKAYYERLTEHQKTQKLHQIYEQALTLSELINAVLDTARFAEYKHKPPSEKADLVTSLQAVIHELLPQAENNQQNLIVLSSPQLSLVWGEQTDLKRIWRNLISNAIKYAGKGASITTAIYETTSLAAENIQQLNIVPSEVISNKYIIATISDNGPGIREQDKVHLFTRFFRGWAAGTNIHGTGLGLSLVKEILQSYGGDIAVHSEANVETTFCFWVPKPD